MADISGFVYVVGTRRKMEDGRFIQSARITAGNGSLTYPANGIPLSAGKLGLPYGHISTLVVTDGNANGSADGIQYKWDSVNSTIRAYQDHTELSSGSATPTINIVVEVKGY